MANPMMKTDAMAVSPMAHALARLADSRARLQRELLPTPEPERDGEHAGAAGAGFWPAPLMALWRRGRRLLRRALGHSPAAAAVMGGLAGAVRDAWQRHPWRPTAELLRRESGAAVLPLLRRHPLTAVALAAAVGMALVASRPWHGPMLSRQLRAGPRRLGHWLLHQLTQPSVQTALLSMLVMAVQRGGSDESPAAAGPADVSRVPGDVPSGAGAAAL